MQPAVTLTLAKCKTIERTVRKDDKGEKMGAASAYLCFFIPVVSLLPLYCTRW